MDDPPPFVTPAFLSQVTRLDAPADYPCPIYERNSAAVNREIDTSGHYLPRSFASCSFVHGGAIVMTI